MFNAFIQNPRKHFFNKIKKAVCRIKPFNYSHFDQMFINYWSKYNNEHFPALSLSRYKVGV